MELRAALLVNIALTTLSAAVPILDQLFPAPANVFYQKLDHFDPDNQEHFEQRYYKRDYSFYDGAPIFLVIGGESPQEGYFPGLIHETAFKHQGVIMALEHRYYGESVPESYYHREPKYLSSEQALADVANFIQAQKKLYPNSPWIVSGCSYSGNLATWMRLKYPHLVQGAIAGSAPVLAKVDFSEYYEVIGEVIKKRAPLCHQKLVEANEELATLAKTRQGQRKLAKMFGSIRYTPSLGRRLHRNLVNSMIVVNGKDLQALEYYRPYTSEVCNLITRNTHGKSALEILINEFGLSGRTDALDSIITRGFLSRSPLDDYMWHYQVCHEFGYFQTLSSKQQPFGEGLDANDYAIRLCRRWNIDLEMVEDNIRKTNLRYGGRTPNVTNVVFMHGSHDPWYPLGVLSDLSTSARAFIFQGLSHCEFQNGRGYYIIPDERIPEWMKIYDELDSIVGSWF